MKKIISVLLALLLLAGCAAQEVPETTQPETQYDWMAGECPFTIRRTGMVNAGMNHSDYEVTEDGTYFIYQHPFWSINEPYLSPVILYVDHGSDTVIKLCGRADCGHQTESCNSYILKGNQLTWYDGYLYAIGEGAIYELSEGDYLIRMDPDGTNRVKILNLKQFARENGFNAVTNSTITNGICFFGMTTWELQEDGSSQQMVYDYYYKLDGSMEEPAPVDAYFLYSCGDVFLCLGEGRDGDPIGGYYNWDPDTNTTTFLCDHPGEPGWFGKEEAMYFKDGALRRLIYATGEEEILIDTDLKGDYYATLFPDCIVIAYNELEETDDMNLYIYNWDYELVDTVEIGYQGIWDFVNQTIIAETAERFILTDYPGGLPRYYINKSELGTGDVQIHEFNMPDLTKEVQYFEEEFADMQWLENG